MANPIGWCDETINFFTGCRQGCPWCYARRMAHRLGHIPGTVYQRVAAETSGRDQETGILDGDGDPFAPAWHGDVAKRAYEKLTRWVPDGRGSVRYTHAPRRVFVGSMGDMCFEGGAICFGEQGGRAGLFGTREVQHLTARWAAHVEPAGHTVLVLTKRPDLLASGLMWPRNLHLGVSLERNANAWRVGELRDRLCNDAMLRQGTAPGVIWASVEPLLEAHFKPECLTGLDWVVVGFESSLARARKRTVVGVDRDPTVRDVPRGVAVQRIVAWCRDHGVPVFCKDSVAAVCGGVWPQELPMVRGPHARADFA